MPKFEVTVLTKYECEAEDETQATIACTSLATASVEAKGWQRTGSAEYWSATTRRGTIKPCSSDVTRVFEILNGTEIADNLADVDREDPEAGVDCCEICAYPASAGHDAGCPKCPSFDKKSGKATGGFLSTPSRERESDEFEDTEALMRKNLQTSMDGTLETPAMRIALLVEKEDRGEIEDDEKAELKEHRERNDVQYLIAVGDDALSERGPDENRDLAAEAFTDLAFTAIDLVEMADVPRVLRRVMCRVMTVESPKAAQQEIQMNAAASAMACDSYTPDIIFGRDPNLKLYVDFQAQKVRQMERPHMLVDGQLWF